MGSHMPGPPKLGPLESKFVVIATTSVELWHVYTVYSDGGQPQEPQSVRSTLLKIESFREDRVIGHSLLVRLRLDTALCAT